MLTWSSQTEAIRGVNAKSGTSEPPPGTARDGFEDQLTVMPPPPSFRGGVQGTKPPVPGAQRMVPPSPAFSFVFTFILVSSSKGDDHAILSVTLVPAIPDFVHSLRKVRAGNTCSETINTFSYLDG
jgi:hypothetical protein